MFDTVFMTELLAKFDTGLDLLAAEVIFLEKQLLF